MSRLLLISDYFHVCPLRRIPGGSALFRDKAVRRNWSGKVIDVEVDKESVWGHSRR